MISNKAFFLFFSFFLFSKTVFSYETKGQLKCPSENLLAGKFYRCQLTLWPITPGGENEFYLLKNQRFLNLFYIQKIHRLERSSNNADAVEIDFDLVALKSGDLKEFYLFNFRALNVPISLNMKSVTTSKKELKEFELFKLNEPLSSQRKLLWFIAALIAGALSWYVIQRRKRRSSKKGNSTFSLDDLLKQMNSRSDLERLYQYRKDFLERSSEPQKTKEFFQALNRVQYQEKWETETFNSLLEQSKVLKLEEVSK